MFLFRAVIAYDWAGLCFVQHPQSQCLQGFVAMKKKYYKTGTMAQSLHYLYIRSSERRDQNPNKESKMEKQTPTPYQKEIDLIIAAIQETPWMLYQVKKLVRRAEAERKEK